jgi:hypothetical protein
MQPPLHGNSRIWWAWYSKAVWDCPKNYANSLKSNGDSLFFAAAAKTIFSMIQTTFEAVQKACTQTLK